MDKGEILYPQLAIFLCIVFWPLALHRFYLNHRLAAIGLIVINLISLWSAFYINENLILIGGLFFLYEFCTLYERVKKHNLYVKGKTLTKPPFFP